LLLGADLGAAFALEPKDLGVTGIGVAPLAARGL
jgi:hypothetical protein